MEPRQAVRFVEALEGNDALRQELERRLSQGADTEQVLADVSARLGWPLGGREIEALLASAVALSEFPAGQPPMRGVLSAAVADGALSLANSDLQDALARQRQSYEAIVSVAKNAVTDPDIES